MNEKVLMSKVLMRRAFQAKGMAVEHFFFTGPGKGDGYRTFFLYRTR